MPDRDNSNIQKKIIRHRLVAFYKVLVLVIILVAIITGIYYYWTQITYSSYDIIQEYDYQKSGEAQTKVVDNSIVIYSKDGMSMVDSKGKTIWNQTYEIQKPMIKTCEKTIAIADYNGRNIYVANTDKILGTITTTMPIRDFCVSANGIVAVVLDDTTITGIYLYDTSGNNPVYFKTTMTNSGYPIAIDMSKDGKQMVISYLKAEAGKMTTTIGFYNFSSVGQNYTDNLVGGYGYQDDIIPMVSYMNNDTVFAVSNDSILFYQGKEIPTNINNIGINSEIKSVFHSDEYIGVVIADTTGEAKYELQVFNTLGNQLTKLAFNLDYQDIKFDRNGIIIYNETECNIYNWKNHLKYEGLFSDSIDTVISTGTVDRYILISKSKIQSIQLR